MEKKLQRGRIVWTAVIDPQGNTCVPHAVVILTPDEDIDTAVYLRGVVVSSKLHHTSPDDQVNLPWDRRPGGHVATRLKERCAAICNWVVRFKKSDITPDNLGGIVTPKYLLPIVKKVIDLAPREIAVP